MSWVDLCGADDLTEGSAKGFEVGGVPVALVRSDAGWFAVHDVCSHAEVALSEGEVDGACIECWLHGSRFDLRTGKPLDPPATRPVPVYPVRVEGGRVLVQIEES